MKSKYILLPIVAIMIGSSHSIAQQSQQVTREEAAAVAMWQLTDADFSIGRFNANNRNIQITEKRDNTGNILLYEVSTDSLSILLSGSRACYPILAKTSIAGSPLLDNYDNLPANMRWIIDAYTYQVAQCFRIDTISLWYNDVWDSHIEGSALNSRNSTEAKLDFTPHWNQYGCNNGIDSIGYEYSMPLCNDNHHSKVGCGAVAMGQIMYYWKHPVSPSWKEGFDWCNMVDRLYDTSSTFLQNREAISHLLKECAEPITTDYGCDQTYSVFSSIPNALQSFGYNVDFTIHDKQDYTNEEWIDIVKQQIDNGYPFIYSGGGHVFVCFGYAYDDNDYFYYLLNFGYGDGGNAWCRLDDISYEPHASNNESPSRTFHFNANQRIIVDIHPNNRIDLCNRVVDLADYYTYWQNELDGHHPWDILPTTATVLTSADNASDALWRTIPEGASATYKAHKSITLRDGFSVERGADFTAYIDPCAFCESGRGVPQNVSAPSISSPEQGAIQNGFIDDTLNKSVPRTGILMPSGSVIVYPNPAQGEITVEIPNAVKGDVHIQIMDMYGRQLLSHSENVDAVSYRQQMDIRAVPSGCYYAVVTVNGNRIIKCIVKQK
ncbi:MAG: C10 family peptidase [Bacteroidales bacterium]|nr:C10 family peptidase [Bacteroidales bacterium]